MITFVQTSENRLIGKVSEIGHREKTLDLSVLLILRGEWRRFIEPMMQYANGLSFTSQYHWLEYFLFFGRAFKSHEIKFLPADHDSWQELIVNFYAFCLTDTQSKATLKSRIVLWRHLITPLKVLRDATDVIPSTVKIPRTKNNHFDCDANVDQLLGESSDQKVEGTIDKLLVSVRIGRTDAAYLQEVRDDLVTRRAAIEDACLIWWHSIEAHYKYGQSLLAKTDFSSLNAELEDEGLGKRLMFGGMGRKHLVGPPTEASLGNLLAIFHHHYDGVVTSNLFKQSSFLPSRPPPFPASAPAPPSSLVTPMHRLRWMLGCLTSLDMAYILMFISIKLPKFNIISLINSKLKTKHGASYFEPSNSGISFRIEKARAKSMKQHILDKDTLQILTGILHMTSSARKRLDDLKDPDANKVFIALGRNKVQAVVHASVVMHINGNNMAAWIGDYSPELISAGLTKGTISFRKIRATEAVLEWFKTGSIQSASRKIGNTTKVILIHYIPKPLITAWHTRQLRRYQNLFICIAAANENFLLDVTDFHSLIDLHSFLQDMLVMHAHHRSPLNDELRKRFAALESITETSDTPSLEGRLAVPISKYTLAYLLYYRDCAYENGLSRDYLDTPDSVAGLKPRSFIYLAELLAHRLPNESDPALRGAFAAAESLLPELKKRFLWDRKFFFAE